MAATMTTVEVAQLLGVSERTIRRAVGREKFAVKPLRINRRVVFSRTAIYRLAGLNEGKASSSPDERCAEPHDWCASCVHGVAFRAEGRGDAKSLPKAHVAAWDSCQC